MQNNFQSLSYFLPEILIVFTILFVIISDLISDLKKYSFHLAVFGVLASSLLVFMGGFSADPKMLFNDLLIFDSFSYYFKCIILFSTLSIIIVSLVTVSSNYSSLADEPNIVLPVMIISIFLFLGFFVHKKIESNKDLISYMLFTFMPILIGMGFYVSTVSTIVVIFSMQYFFNGVFKFFTNHNDDLLGSDDGVEGNVDMGEMTDIDDEIDSLNILDKN